MCGRFRTGLGAVMWGVPVTEISSIVDIFLLLVGVVHVGLSAHRGFVSSVCGVLGFVAAGLVAVLAVPRVVLLLDPVADPTLHFRATLVLIMVAAWVGMMAGAESTGSRSQKSTKTALDTFGGLVVGALGFVMVCGCATQLIWYSGDVRLTQTAAESSTLVRSGSLWPDDAAQWAFDVLPQRVAEASGIPAVTIAGPPGQATSSGGAADPAALARVADAVAGSVIKISGVAQGCQQGQEGSGVVVGHERVMTNAHVVSGVPQPLVQITGRGRHYASTVVYYDSDLDVAILAVPGLPAPTLPASLAPATAGDDVTALGFPLSGSYSSAPGHVQSSAVVTGTDIYSQKNVQRPVISATTSLLAGNSGGPLVNTNGYMVGLVFAKAAEQDLPGYAISIDALFEPIAKAPSLHTALNPGQCIPIS